MPTHSHEYVVDGERASFNKTASGEVNLEETISADQTDTEYTLALDISALKSLFLHCDIDLKIETNSGSAPDDTINLTGGVPLVWSDDSEHANPFSADVTSIFCTEENSAGGTLKLKALQDASP